MAQEHRSATSVTFGASRWQAAPSRVDIAMQPTAGARTIDLRGSFRSAQAMAGSGALVFEGELLEGPRFPVH
jgi:hypothetical protein